MLGKDYSFESNGTNLGITPLLQFQNKIIVIVDKTNTSFLENQNFLEYVNLTSNSMFMRAYNYDLYVIEERVNMVVFIGGNAALLYAT